MRRSTVVVVETNNIQTIIGQTSKLLNLLPNLYHVQLMFDSHKSEVQKVQRSNLDELDADHDLDQVRFEVLVLARTLFLGAKSPISVPFRNQTQAQVDGSLSGGLNKKTRRSLSKK